MAWKTGRELVVGDVLDLWYNCEARIIKIEIPGYNGVKENLFSKEYPNGYIFVTTTALTKSGKSTITIGNDEEINTVEKE